MSRHWYHIIAAAGLAAICAYLALDNPIWMVGVVVNGVTIRLRLRSWRAGR